MKFPSVDFQALQGYRIHDGSIVGDVIEARRKSDVESRRQYMAQLIMDTVPGGIDVDDALAIASAVATRFVLVPLDFVASQVDIMTKMSGRPSERASSDVNADILSDLVHRP